MKHKVLHLLASNKFSGAENVACNIILNTKFNSFYCSPNGPIKDILKDKGINYLPIDKLTVKNVKKIVDENNITIIHAHDFKASFIASCIASDNVKVISHIHCNYNLLKMKKLVAFIYSKVQKKFSKVIVVSDEILEKASFGRKIAPKTEVLYNVINKNEIMNKSTAFTTDEYDLAFLGRLIDIKQPIFFIELVNDLKNSFPSIKACMVGNGDLYNNCENKINELKLNENIDLVGFKNNPFPYIKNSKVLILPSKYEGLPMSVIEAMVLGVPVVNSGVGGLSKVFENNQEYICHNKHEYINEIKKILNDNSNKYINDCVELISDYINMNNYINKIESIYKSI